MEEKFIYPKIEFYAMSIAVILHGVFKDLSFDQTQMPVKKSISGILYPKLFKEK